jgi:cytochrome c
MMKTKLWWRLLPAISIVFGALTSTALADGDATLGKVVFAKNCSMCHEAEKPRHGGGPSLMGIIGRPAASTDFRRYSTAMKASGIVWDAEILAKFVSGPRLLVKGTAMPIAGLKNPDDITNLVAYFTSLSNPAQ